MFEAHVQGPIATIIFIYKSSCKLVLGGFVHGWSKNKLSFIMYFKRLYQMPLFNVGWEDNWTCCLGGFSILYCLPSTYFVFRVTGNVLFVLCLYSASAFVTAVKGLIINKVSFVDFVPLWFITISQALLLLFTFTCGEGSTATAVRLCAHAPPHPLALAPFFFFPQFHS